LTQTVYIKNVFGISKVVPEALKSSLPQIEDLEKEFKDIP
jgi:hypothetical protein